MVVSNWIAKLLDLLCNMYRAWGGDCADLPLGASAQVQTLVATYAAHGAPQFGSESPRQAFLSTLTDLETHLDHQDNELEPQDESALRTLIQQLRTDLSPP